MPTKVIMPSLGESVDEGVISRWLKQPGEQIEEYEPLLEINTDKVDSEIPSPATGTLLKIMVDEGNTVTAGTLLALIGEPDEAADAEQEADTSRQQEDETQSTPHPTQTVQEAAPQAAEQPAAAPPVGRDRDLGFISPVVSKIAHEHQVDLAQVQGSGMGGRITKKDVLAYINQRQEGPQAAPQAAAAGPSLAPTRPSEPEKARPQAAMPAAQPGEVMPLSNVRKAIAEHMVMSKRTSPHVTTIMEVDLNRVVKHRQAHKEGFARDGVNLTFTAYFISAAVQALKAYPVVNSSWSDEGVILHKQVNMGMATSLGESGLIVPVIKTADQYSLLGLTGIINDLANRARSRELKPDEVRGGTFTITNHGTTGSLFATPIINQPQCGILGVGAIQKRVVVIDDAIAIRPMVYVSLTFDHRILDGAIADNFLGTVVKFLQDWE